MDISKDLDDVFEILSVSSGDSPGNPDDLESVSGGDNIGNIPANIYVINMLQDSEGSITAVPQEDAYTIFNKPLEEYTVSEGLLLIIAALAVVAFIWGIVKGGFSWLNW